MITKRVVMRKVDNVQMPFVVDRQRWATVIINRFADDHFVGSFATGLIERAHLYAEPFLWRIEPRDMGFTLVGDNLARFGVGRRATIAGF